MNKIRAECEWFIGVFTVFDFRCWQYHSLLFATVKSFGKWTEFVYRFEHEQ